jgi:hypothetical protein
MRRDAEARPLGLEITEHGIAEDRLQDPAWLHVVDPCFDSRRSGFTSRSGARTGSGRSSI